MRSRSLWSAYALRVLLAGSGSPSSKSKTKTIAHKRGVHVVKQWRIRWRLKEGLNVEDHRLQGEYMLDWQAPPTTVPQPREACMRIAFPLYNFTHSRANAFLEQFKQDNIFHYTLGTQLCWISLNLQNGSHHPARALRAISDTPSQHNHIPELYGIAVQPTVGVHELTDLFSAMWMSIRHRRPTIT